VSAGDLIHNMGPTCRPATRWHPIVAYRARTEDREARLARRPPAAGLRAGFRLLANYTEYIRKSFTFAAYADRVAAVGIHVAIDFKI